VKHNPTEADIRQYFWSLVDKNGPLPDPATGVKSKCWLWLGSVTDQGYGRFKAAGKRYQVRRYAWQEKGRPAPGVLTVSTRCHNKLCVRHLHLKSRAEIMASVPAIGLRVRILIWLAQPPKQYSSFVSSMPREMSPNPRWPIGSACRYQT
jgi:hypothetical protein